MSVLYRSIQPGFYHRLESFIAWIVNTTEKIFQIQKKIIVNVKSSLCCM